MEKNWSLFYRLTGNNGVWNIFYNTTLMECLYHILTYGYDDEWYVVRDCQTTHIPLFSIDAFNMLTSNISIFSFNKQHLKNACGDVFSNYSDYREYLLKYLNAKCNECNCYISNINEFIMETERREEQMYENNKLEHKDKKDKKDKTQFEDSKFLKTLKKYRSMLKSIERLDKMLHLLTI